MSFFKKIFTLFKPKLFYAICYKEGHGSIAARYTVHAFNNELARGAWIANTNQINKIHTGDLLPIAFAVPENDINVRKAREDVKMNPLIYSNTDYINNRVYIEHFNES